MAIERIGILSRSAAQSWKRNARNGARTSTIHLVDFDFLRTQWASAALCAHRKSEYGPSARYFECVPAPRSGDRQATLKCRGFDTFLRTSLWIHCAYLKAFGWICSAARRICIRCRCCCCCYCCDFVSVSLHRDVPEKCTRKQ